MTNTLKTRELRSDEFSAAETIWLDYHQIKSDPVIDRIFGVFLDTVLVSVARCRKHSDGYEVDGIFTRISNREHRYGTYAVAALVEACHNDDLYMHAILSLVPFYEKLGFIQIDETDLPPTIKARFAFALGEMEGSNVHPMMRPAGLKLDRFRDLLDGSL